MKYAQHGFILLLAMLLLVPAASAELITVGDAIDATLLYYQPVPAHPGDLLDVWIQIENNGGKPSSGGTITILDSEQFKLESERDRVKEFPIIPGQETFLVKTKIRVGKEANEGENKLRIRVQENNQVDYIERELAITITGQTSALSILSAQSTPEEILPGESATLTVRVKNVGDTQVRNVDVALDLEDLSFAPVGSSDSKTISQLNGGQEHLFTFDLVSYPSATAQANRIPITLSYDDEQGNAKSQEETVGLVVGAKPELLVYFERIGLTSEKPQGEVVIKFVNKGLAEIKLLEMEVLENENVQVTSESPLLYVGNIDEDDYESAEISLKVTGSDVDIPLRIAYKDALNRDYSADQTLKLHLESKNGNGGSTAGTVFMWLIILAIVIVVVVWLVKRNNSKRRKK